MQDVHPVRVAEQFLHGEVHIVQVFPYNRYPWLHEEQFDEVPLQAVQFKSHY